MHDRQEDELLGDLPTRESVTAVFSSVARRGEWLPPEELRVVAGFGSAKLDFTQALLAPGVTEVRAFAVFGAVELLVPADLDVELDASALFGSVQRIDSRGTVTGFLRQQLRRVTHGEPEERPVEDDPPLLRIGGHAVFGSIIVRVR
jgi:hypothetical protein